MFHGQESQEATLVYPDNLSLHELSKESGSVVEGLKAVREAIVTHMNLVPKYLQNDSEQKRWLKKAVTAYRWARPTTARAHELDFAKMYAALRSQAIEEENSRKVERAGGRLRSKVGDKSLRKQVWFGDMYGNPRQNPKHNPYAGLRVGT